MLYIGDKFVFSAHRVPYPIRCQYAVNVLLRCRMIPGRTCGHLKDQMVLSCVYVSSCFIQASPLEVQLC